jgi:hypothetical protein
VTRTIMENFKRPMKEYVQIKKREHTKGYVRVAGK